MRYPSLIYFQAQEIDTISSDYLTAPKPAAPRKKKRKVDPNAPRRYVNAFIMFCEIQKASFHLEKALLLKRDPLSEAYLALTNTTKAMGSKWKELGDEMEFYKEIFIVDTTMKESDVLIFKKNNQGTTEDDISYEADAPVRKSSPFLVFCVMEDARYKEFESQPRSLEEEEIELAKVSTPIGRRWMELQDSERAVYNSLFDDQKKMFEDFITARYPAVSDQQ